VGCLAQSGCSGLASATYQTDTPSDSRDTYGLWARPQVGRSGVSGHTGEIPAIKGFSPWIRSVPSSFKSARRL
jgi:hypothetical protein